jgi:hypothetical protein
MAAGIAQNCHTVFADSPSRRVVDSASGFLITNIDNWKCNEDNFIAF